ncbi:hypothetical protein GCM10023149_36680 [Mucilaginibacter gynuensis]|uniref:DUF4834 domain-containing protein n=1 Tax=Mucilaginibacter gynuensis TaxID=1302236 RepID=A0ABP8GWR0_9SPHI
MILLRFLLISVLVLYIVRQLARIFLPMLFQSVINKATQQQQRNQNYQQPKRPEGTVKVDYVPQNTKNTVPDNEGEFIDYEEIK